MQSRDKTRRELFIDLALKTAKVGGLAVLLQNTPVYQLAKMLGVKAEHLPLVIRDMGLQEAEAATLPLNYVVTAGTVPTGADVRDGESAVDGNATSAGNGTSSAVDNTNSTYIKNGGAKNLKFTITAGASAHDRYVNWTTAISGLSTVPTMSSRVLWFSGANITTPGGYELYFSTGADTVAYYANHSDPLSTFLQGWQYHQWHRKETSATFGGTFNWASNVVLIQSLFRVNATTGALVAYLDQNYYGGYQHPHIPWIFDGASDTCYTVAYGAWLNKGMQGTLAIPTGLVDSGAGFLTTAQIDEMYAAGWDVIHMSDSTTALTGLSVAAAEARLATAETFMQSKGWTRTPKIIALPGTSFTSHRSDDNLRTALLNRGYIAAFDKWSNGTATSPDRGHSLSIDPDYGISLNPYRVPAWRVEQPDTIAEHRLHIDHAIAAGTTRVLRTSAIGAGGSDMATADHTTLLNEVALKHYAGTLTCAPMRKFISGLSGRMVRP